MAQTTQARHTREASEPNQGLQQAGHVQPLLAQAQELAHVRGNPKTLSFTSTPAHTMLLCVV